MDVAAKPYASWSLTAQGEVLEHAKAEPPSQPEATSGLDRGPSFLSQVVTGLLTAALPDHAHEVYFRDILNI